MGSQERSKKKVHIWSKAIVHFLLCFVMGFFTGFAPTTKPSIFSSHVTMSVSTTYSPEPIEVPHHPASKNFNRSLLDDTPRQNGIAGSGSGSGLNLRRQVIVITPTNKRDRLGKVLIRRLANTLRLVAQPLVWIVVERKSEDNEVSEILRNTGIMYRHVVYKENFSDVGSEMDHQRNIALNHIEHHRLSGIVHFAALSNVYDLRFFEEIRAIEAFGTWAIAKVSGNKKRVIMEGAICESSEVMGWHLRRSENGTQTTPPHVSSFAFNSSILWDPERWGRTSSVKQNSLKFVREGVVEEESKLKGIPAEGCSKILLWDFHFH